MADADIATKACSRCGEVKPREEFHRDKSRSDGLCNVCKECNKARAAAWFREHREQHRETGQRYYAEHKDGLLASMRQWREKNSERARAAQAAWRAANPERKRANDLRWQAENRERHLMYRRVSEARRKAAKQGSTEQHTAADIEALFKLQRNRCACCKVSLRHGYHVDHIEPLARGGSNGRLNIQLLCPSCNTRKNAKDPIAFMQETGRLL